MAMAVAKGGSNQAKAKMNEDECEKRKGGYEVE